MPENLDPDQKHTVVPGDRMSKIAFEHGYDDYAKLWNATENAALKKLRKNPEVLLPGDRVFLPDKTEAQHPTADKKVKTFAVETSNPEIRVKLTFAGKPLTGTVQVFIDTHPYSTKNPFKGEVTLDHGVAKFHVLPSVTEVQLISTDPAYSIKLLVGHLHPIDAGVGVEQRLDNQGYFCPTDLPPVPASSEAAKTTQARHAALRKKALARYQAARGHNPDGTPDAATLAALTAGEP